jgi:uncharacterized protein YuzE
VKLKAEKGDGALYCRLDDAEIVESEEVQPGIILDFDEDERVVGVEVQPALGLNPEFVAILAAARAEFDAGKTVSLEEMLAELNGDCG